MKFIILLLLISCGKPSRTYFNIQNECSNGYNYKTLQEVAIKKCSEEGYKYYKLEPSREFDCITGGIVSKAVVFCEDLK